MTIAGVDDDTWTAVLLQGSGTYAVEAVLQTTSPRQGARVLVIANGAYGKRMVKICQVAGIECDVVMSSEVLPVDIDQVFLSKNIIQTLSVMFTTLLGLSLFIGTHCT